MLMTGPSTIEDAESSKAPTSSRNFTTLQESDRSQVWETYPDNPFNWSPVKKWRIFLMVCLTILLVGLNSTVIATPGAVIAKRFNVDVDNPNIDNTVWLITAWNTGAAIGPMLGIPFLEAFGSRFGIVFYIIFLLSVIVQAVAPSFTSIIVTRAIAGFFGGIVMCWPECILADMWFTDPERDVPVTLFIVFYMAGITLGPAFGSLISVLSWRWVSYVQVIIYATLFLPLVLVVEETRDSVIRDRLIKQNPTLAAQLSPNHKQEFNDSHRSPQRPSSKTTSRPTISPRLLSLLYTAVLRPFHMLVTESVVVAFTLWNSLCFGIVYTCIQSISQTYQFNYSFTDTQCGYLQVSILIGLVLGVVPCLYQNAIYQRCTRQNNGIPIPERRLPASIIASLIGLVGGLFWYGWTSYPHLHWILPTINLAFIGFGVQVVITASTLYITDAYTMFAGSAVSCLAFGENIFAAWLPLATRKMYSVLGYQWASTAMAAAALVLTAAPACLLIWGKEVRDRSHFIREARHLE